MNQTFAIAAGGAIGSVLRFWLSSGVYAWLGRGFPWGTLAVNVLGSLLIGVLYVLMVERTGTSDTWRAFAMVGLLGGFTTFSTFSLETLQLIHQTEYLRALANAGLSFATCIIAAGVAVVATRSFI